MRVEQCAAVEKAHAYFHSIWKGDIHAAPRFLWNAKMRFGKTFTAYQLAKKLGATRVLVVTFKPAVEDAWQTDLEQAVLAFRRYEDASLRYTGIESHAGLTHYGLYDTVVARD
jgi:hypothetical protein